MCKEDSKVSAPESGATSDTLCDSMIRSFSSLYFHSETTAKRFLAKLAACVSARGHKDRYFSELASNTRTRNLLSDNLGRKSFSSYRCDQSESRGKMFFRDLPIAPESRILFCLVLFILGRTHDFGDRQKGYLFICFLNEASLKSNSLKR